MIKHRSIREPSHIQWDEDIDDMPDLIDNNNSNNNESKEIYINSTCSCCHQLLYKCNIERLGHYKNIFFELSKDNATTAFLDFCDTPSWYHAAAVCFIRPMIRLVLSHTDSNAFLNTGRMFLLSTNHCRQLLLKVYQNNHDNNVNDNSKFGTLLDVGAGDGGITSYLEPLFNKIIATEVSTGMVKQLQNRGYTAVHIDDLDLLSPDICTKGTAQVITCLNVLDRCDQPLTLLSSLRRLMDDNTLLIIATPLPFAPSVEKGTKWVNPSEYINMKRYITKPGHYTLDWELSAALFAEHVLEARGFHVQLISRIPYISQGDQHETHYLLDDAIFIVKRKE